MADPFITFPRALPDELVVVGMSFYLRPTAELLPTRAGRQIALNLGPDLWLANYSSSPLTPEQSGIVRSWYDTVLSYETFLAYDRMRQYPLEYADGWPFGPPFDGVVLLTGVDPDNSVVIELSDCPVGFVFSVGDFLAFDYGTDSRALHRVAHPDVADANGVAVVEVRPAVRPGWDLIGSPPERPVDLYRPTAKMVILPDSWSEQQSGGDKVTVSFAAVQTL